jgi:hypothetical protein
LHGFGHRGDHFVRRNLAGVEGQELSYRVIEYFLELLHIGGIAHAPDGRVDDQPAAGYREVTRHKIRAIDRLEGQDQVCRHAGVGKTLVEPVRRLAEQLSLALDRQAFFRDPVILGEPERIPEIVRREAFPISFHFCKLLVL